MELFNKMKKKSCLKGCLSALLVIIFILGLLYLLLLLYGKYHTYNRTFVADAESVGWEITFTEIEHDSILAFSFNRKGDDQKVSSLFVYNDSRDVVSFIFSEDTIYIRDEMEFQDLFPPEERDKHPIPPKDFKKGGIVKGDLPSSCRVIPYSDSRFFSYDEKKHNYLLKDSTMHIIKLVHYVERANDYDFFDVTLKEVSGVPLMNVSKDYKGTIDPHVPRTYQMKR